MAIRKIADGVCQPGWIHIREGENFELYDVGKIQKKGDTYHVGFEKKNPKAPLKVVLPNPEAGQRIALRRPRP